MTAEAHALVGVVAASLTRLLRPMVAASCSEWGGWPEAYRRRGAELPPGDAVLDDLLFLLRVVAENPSRFPAFATSPHVGLARQRFARAFGPAPEAADVVACAEVATGLFTAADVAVPPEVREIAVAPAGDDGAESATGPSVVARWLGDLLDLTRHNPLISLGDRGVPLLVDEDAIARVEDVLADGLELVVHGWDDLDGVEDGWAGLSLPSVSGPGDLPGSFLDAMLDDEASVFLGLDVRSSRRTLQDMRRRATVVAEETGASPLYLTVGALRMDDRTAPLFLVPVVVEGPQLGPWTLHMEPGAEPRLNECLVEFLRREDGFSPTVLTSPPTDHAGLDVPRIFAELREALAGRRFPYEVVADMRLALLHFSTLTMWRDLHEHADVFTANPVVRHLAEGRTEFVDPVPEPVVDASVEDELSLPLPADGTQMRAVRWAREGRSFVVQGPPGTGKSQTIANLMADAVAAGRRVLFVAEKDAALEVVQRRLDAVGLAHRSLDMRAKDLTIRAVREHLVASSQRRSGAGSAALESARRRHRSLVDELEALPAAMRAGGLPQVDGEARARQVEAYREAAEQRRAALREWLRNADVVPRHGYGDAAVLARELRVARTSTVRELFETHAEAILDVTPCVLAGPAAVARYLPARADLFDLVVFDEASQIRVEAAIGATGRGSATVVVGDPQQMPPSDPLVPDGEDDQQESILLEAVCIGMPVVRLSWHYRSRSEGLVAFSNAHYYDGTLASFPMPPGGTGGAGVEFRRCDGRYEMGRGRKEKVNLTEAQEVVAEVVRLLTEDPQASVGVVTFNTAQRDVVLDRLEDAAAPQVVKDALVRESEPLIVKALEHIQGDERDHILFSATYSVDASGTLPANFGLLSRRGGERRLNVAITRARVRNVVFASFEPTDIDRRSSAVSQGPAHLRDYLLAARHGQADAATSASIPDPARTMLAARLRTRGLEVLEDVGMSQFKVDLAVRRAGGPWIAVLLDTDEWIRRLTVADRDGIPDTVLGTYLGWAAVHQVYREEMRRDPEVVLGRILALTGQVAGVPETVSAVEAAMRGGVVAPAPPCCGDGWSARVAGVGRVCRSHVPRRRGAGGPDAEDVDAARDGGDDGSGGDGDGDVGRGAGGGVAAGGGVGRGRGSRAARLPAGARRRDRPCRRDRRVAGQGADGAGGGRVARRRRDGGPGARVAGVVGDRAAVPHAGAAA